MVNGAQPSGDDVVPFFVCPAVREAMRRTRQPWLTLNPGNETVRGLCVRLLSAARQTLRPEMAWSWTRVSSSCGTGNGIARPTFAAPCGVMRHVPRSTNQRSREIRDAADRPALCRGGVLFGFCPVGVFLAPAGSSGYLSFRRSLRRGSKLLGTI